MVKYTILGIVILILGLFIAGYAIEQQNNPPNCIEDEDLEDYPGCQGVTVKKTNATINNEDVSLTYYHKSDAPSQWFLDVVYKVDPGDGSIEYRQSKLPLEFDGWPGSNQVTNAIETHLHELATNDSIVAVKDVAITNQITVAKHL